MLFFFRKRRFPKHVILLRQWLDVIVLPKDIKWENRRICSEHFSVDDYEKPGKLTSTAVPRFELTKKKPSRELREETRVTKPRIYVPKKYKPINFGVSEDPGNTKLITAYTKDGSLINVRVPCSQESEANVEMQHIDSNSKSESSVVEAADESSVVEATTVDTYEQAMDQDEDVSTDQSNVTECETSTTEITDESQNFETPGHVSLKTFLKQSRRYYFIIFCL